MGKRKWLLGSGIAAVGVTALNALRHRVSGNMVRLAMDRDGVQNTEADFDRVSGHPFGERLHQKILEAKERLEQKDSEKVEIVSEDGIRLAGHWFVCENAKRIIVAMHGWRSGWSRDYGFIADFLHDSGCSVLYAEQRGHGCSGGEYIGFGLLERYDCRLWAKWVEEQNAAGLPIYLAGISMGATTVLMAGGLELPENVHGILADCAFTSAHAIWKHVAEKNLHLHYGLYAGIADALCKKKIRIGAKDYSTVDAMKQCKVPVLFIHGTDDHFVPVEMTYENYKACASEKCLYIVPGAEHAMSYLMDKEGYEDQIVNFWHRFDAK